jgi:mRNA interferase MazF
VWWLEDPTIGRRPVLILSRDSVIDVLTAVVVAPITRTVHHIDSEVLLDETDGMPQVCAASFDNLRTVPKSLLTQRVAGLSPPRIFDMCSALGFALDC